PPSLTKKTTANELRNIGLPRFCGCKHKTLFAFRNAFCKVFFNFFVRPMQRAGNAGVAGRFFCAQTYLKAEKAP
ncbi:hypothetical protein, partial [Hyunsoonleella rubra]